VVKEKSYKLVNNSRRSKRRLFQLVGDAKLSQVARGAVVMR